MLYALLIYGPEAPPDPDALDAALARHRALQAETRAAGTLAGSVRLAPTSAARHVRRAAGKPLIIDGPFAETKELLAGFYLIDCADADEAARHAAQICCSPHDRIEIRPVDWRSPEVVARPEVTAADDDPGRYSVIGHRGMPLWHPNDPGAIERLIDAAGLDADSRALDVGCGRGEVALRIVEQTGARVRAVDLSPAAIAIARNEAAHRDPRGRLEPVCAPFDAKGEAPVDLAVCIGSTHVVGGFDGALETLGALLRPGGRILIGEGFWAAEPDPQWIAQRFGGQRDAFHELAALRARFTEAGWRVVAEHRVSPAGWTAYEVGHNTNLRAASGPDAEAMRARSDAWHEDWKRWGSALGFGLWLAERA